MPRPPAASPPPIGQVGLLLLWDVDHTLVDSGGVGRECYLAAFEKVTGRAVEHDVDVTGRTEQAIFLETAGRHGVEVTPERAERYRVELAGQYRARLPELRRRGRALPWAPESLESVAAQPGTLQTVLTGNYEDVAALKLTTFDLDRHLALTIGAYGEDAVERADLVPLARARAQQRYELSPNVVVVVIGDSVGDVTAARGQALTIAVASGRSPIGDLAAARPDIVLDDLAGLPDAVRALQADDPSTPRH